ncbi:hypothetical protein SteCoe_18767 [Stentor coeruleus]|uniref:Uncharacterized protein n=1 Tax=Stentor coeruleus TaxID=5963 RepID=A0A1R2BWA2_9CILI|nr:hypothetical protein SteCoe_18767 [Stentor coeruleus]
MGAGASDTDANAAGGSKKTRRVPEISKNKLPHDVLEGFTSYMKSEIDKSQELQKRNRYTAIKSYEKKPTVTDVIKNTILGEPNKIFEPLQEKPQENSSKNETFDFSNNHGRNPQPLNEDKKVPYEKNSIEKIEESKDQVSKSKFVVESIEREIDEYENPESPRPAPPVFDDNFEIEVVYSKQERVAKEKEALNVAQKVAYEQKVKEEKELGEKKQALNQLEDKFENITAKYLK